MRAIAKEPIQSNDGKREFTICVVLENFFVWTFIALGCTDLFVVELNSTRNHSWLVNDKLFSFELFLFYLEFLN